MINNKEFNFLSLFEYHFYQDYVSMLNNKQYSKING